MEQDINGISWKHLPWKKFQQKSFRLQRKIYEARCSGNSKVLLRFQKLLINSESIYYLAVRKVTEDYLDSGVFLSSEMKLNLVHQIRKKFNCKSFAFQYSEHRKSRNVIDLIKYQVREYICKFITDLSFLETSITETRAKFMPLQPNLHMNLKHKRQSISHFGRSFTSRRLDFLIRNKILLSKFNYSFSRFLLTLKHNFFSRDTWNPIRTHRPIFQNEKLILFWNWRLFEDRRRFFYFINFCYLINKVEKTFGYRHMYSRKFKEILLNYTDKKKVEWDFNFFTAKSRIEFFNTSRSPFMIQTYSQYSFKKTLISILSSKNLSKSLIIARLKALILSWYKMNKLCYRSELKNKLFSLKKSLFLRGISLR